MKYGTIEDEQIKAHLLEGVRLPIFKNDLPSVIARAILVKALQETLLR